MKSEEWGVRSEKWGVRSEDGTARRTVRSIDRSIQGVIKGPGGTSALLAYSDDSHQPLTQSWNTTSSWISPNQWEIYQIKPHFDQIGTVNFSQRL